VYPEPGPADYPTMRGKVTALAKHLWQRMEASGYDMLNVPPQTTAVLDGDRWKEVYAAFQQQFAELRSNPAAGGSAALPARAAAVSCDGAR
jgi:hypothetical protein